jgi:predicted TIM-barrel fold metal-dependent hydrolase
LDGRRDSGHTHKGGRISCSEKSNKKEIGMAIDVFCHYISRGVAQRIGRVRSATEFRNSPEKWDEGFKFPRQSADPEVRMALMDKHGIAIQALSLTAETLRGFDVEETAEICRLSNDANYAVCKAYPDRFVNLCILSLLDMKSAMKEFERSVSELDCRGITVASNQNGKGLDSPDYFPFYEKLVQHDLPLFIHPTHWGSYPLADDSSGWEFMGTFGWPFDSTLAVWRLIFGGIIDRFPTLKVVMHHLGAMFPFFAGRIENVYQRVGDKLPRHISEYWGNIYGDTALSGGIPAAYTCGYAFFGPDRIMYASDYPFGGEAGEQFIRENLVGVRSMSIPSAEMEKILNGNARRLLKIG